MNLPKNPFRENDSSALFLIATNIATIIAALIFNWGLLTIMWGYWLQSVIIGFFTVFKILLAREIIPPTVDGLIKGENQLKKLFGVISKIFSACFFAVHYGGFHFGYMVFLLIFTLYGLDGTGVGMGNVDALGIAFMGAAFFILHFYSFVHNYLWRNERQTVQDAFAEPYKRILPMHITIILGGIFIGIIPEFAEKATLVLFMALKTGADYAMHKKEHEKNAVQKTPNPN
ncbi:MAG: DUF6498-containing protein [archaeon]